QFPRETSTYQELQHRAEAVMGSHKLTQNRREIHSPSSYSPCGAGSPPISSAPSNPTTKESSPPWSTRSPEACPHHQATDTSPVSTSDTLSKSRQDAAIVAPRGLPASA